MRVLTPSYPLRLPLLRDGVDVSGLPRLQTGSVAAPGLQTSGLKIVLALQSALGAQLRLRRQSTRR